MVRQEESAELPRLLEASGADVTEDRTARADRELAPTNCR
ncbi:hypothetical protein trd_A0746 (plasmid) [Thermomicrobium roseum DSM 5159]|uniref:Uncharacterized protein n=1 Tax=Thermomicrobium roseum (strain ATCC 27502 / DSM 5159 / P-2) TaxID=309801 RepID=B9L4N2_THERP|nr:hypothetical protein trd_A0746 [Thermomicrobium roseum DSM 5159]